MPDGGVESERYALLQWFARDDAVGPRGVCYRCASTDQFTGARIVRSEAADCRVIASAEDRPALDRIRPQVETAIREGTVQVLEDTERPVACVPLTGAADDLVLALETNWQDDIDRTDRSFLNHLGKAGGVAVDRDISRPDARRSPGENAGADSTASDASADSLDDDERRQKLQALQVTAENLVRARSKPEIARVAVDTARDVLDCPVTGIWFHDEEDDVLAPAAVTEEGRDLLGEPVSFERGESLAWEAFESGDIGHYDDVRTVDGAYNPGTPIRSELNLPIGDHGVLTTATTRLAEFTDGDLDLLRILVSNTEAVLDRAEYERDIERYREMVEAANDPIWAIDTEGRLTHVNQRFVALSDHARETLVGSQLSFVFPEELVDRTWDAIGDLRASEEYTTTYQETITGSGGDSGTYQISLSLLSDREEYVGAVFVAHDVTELRRNEQLLSVFNRVLRHNLRNQMTLVLSHVEGLADHDDDGVAEPAATAAKAAGTLLELSEKTRRFRDVIIPKEATVRPVNLSEKVDGVIESARTEYPHATVRATVPDDARVRANGTLSFAIDELVENAIEHNDGAPEVEVSARPRDGEDTVELRIADDGPGIPEVERRGLDQHLEKPLQHTSGLGLWMVRWSVDTAGGSIEIRDNDPRGTVVVLTLPSAEETPARE